jgi:hypothetical protein
MTMGLRPLRPNETAPPIWLVTPPPSCAGVEMCIYRGVQSNVRLVARRFLRPEDVGAGGLMSRDPAAAWDTVYNHSANALVRGGPNEGGVACAHIPAAIWNDLVQSQHLVERAYRGWFPSRLDSTELRVCTQDAADLINAQRITIELVSGHQR